MIFLTHIDIRSRESFIWSHESLYAAIYSLKSFRVVARQNDKTMVYLDYIPKIFFNEEQPKVSIGKVHFDEIRSTRIKPNIPVQFCEPDPNNRIANDEDDSKSINSSYQMNIICQTPNKFNVKFGNDDFENVNLENFVDNF